MQGTDTTQDIVLAQWAQAAKPSVLQRMLALATQPGILSFAIGLPATELFPVQAYALAAASVLANDVQALQYGVPEQALKRHIVAFMKHRGVTCCEEQVFLTAGAQQGMSLLSRLLLNGNGAIVTERTIYSGILQAVEPMQPRLLTVPTHPETGMDVEAVELLLKGPERPAFIYAISDGHNPLGCSMSLEKRHHLVELAKQYHVPILEDDAYGLLGYEDIALPPMRALDDEWVFYLGSFSKILAPALRVGWILAPKKILPGLTVLKEGSDINTGTFSQRTIVAYLDTRQLLDHIQHLRQVYRLQRDTMLQAIQQHFPVGTQCCKPTNGMFLWVTLPGAPDMEEMLKHAIENEQVAFVPGHAFSVNGSQDAAYSMRLNFSYCNPERIESGITRLGRVLSAKK